MTPKSPEGELKDSPQPPKGGLTADTKCKQPKNFLRLFAFKSPLGDLGVRLVFYKPKS